MDKEAWIAIKKYYAQLPEMSEEEQEALLRKLTEEQPDQAAVLRSLISDAGQTAADPVLDLPAISKIKDSDKPIDHVGRIIGKYKLTFLIGIGGMGRVYLADRLDLEAHQQVAIKIISAGYLTEVYKKRFDRERKILSRLNHPHITRIYDGGITEEGTPYIIMEYVEGKPLMEYVSDNKLNLEQRLELFIDLCEAVDYAHRNFVMHRDLKPGNILVTNHGIVKVIDFGIAKILEDEEGEEDLTLMGYIPLTPAYASPEQLTGQPLTVASDIYSLGVILYQLVSGNKPFPGSTKSNMALAERIGHKRTLQKPSSVLSAELSDDLGAWQRKVQGDLDNVVLKALKESPAERYSSVEQLAEDIRRYRNNYPVSAQPDSVAYRFRKWAQRNQTLMVLGVLLTVILLAGIAATLWQARIAQAERNQAQLEAAKASQISEFITRLFENTDPNRSKGEVITSETMLNMGSERLRELDAQPALQAEMYRLIGELYQKQNLYDAAQEHLLQALRLFKGVYGQDHPEVANTRLLMSALYTFMNRSDSAIAYAQGASAYFAQHRERYGLEYVKALNYEGRGKNQMGEYAAAFKALERAEAFMNQWEGPGEAQQVTMASVYNDLSISHRELGKPVLARSYQFKALDQLIIAQGELDQNISSMYGNIARSYYSEAKYDSAEYYSLKALQIDDKIHGGKPSYSSQFAHSDLTKIYIKKGDHEAAMQHARKSLEMSGSLYGDVHVNTAIGLGALADAFIALEQLDSAEKYLEASTLAMNTFYNGKHPMVAWNYWDKATRYHNMGMLDKAIDAKIKCLEVYALTLPDELADIAEAHDILGAWLLEAGRNEEAREALQISFDTWQRAEGLEDERTQASLKNLLDFLEEESLDEELQELKAMLR